MKKPLVMVISEFWSTSSLTGGFLMPGSDTPHLHRIVTNPLQAGWNQLSDQDAELMVAQAGNEPARRADVGTVTWRVAFGSECELRRDWICRETEEAVASGVASAVLPWPGDVT